VLLAVLLEPFLLAVVKENSTSNLIIFNQAKAHPAAVAVIVHSI